MQGEGSGGGRLAGTMNKKHSWTHLAEEARSVHLLKIDGNFSANEFKFEGTRGGLIMYRCIVDGYDWGIRIRFHAADRAVALELVFLGELRAGSVRANLSAKQRIDNGNHVINIPSRNATEPTEFRRPMDPSPPIYIDLGRPTNEVKTLMVECTITVFAEPAQGSSAPIAVPPSDLSRNFGDLLQSQAGADVTFSVSGKSFLAHKSVLDARCPVDLFGEMKEKDAQLVEIQDMDAATFRAMLQFIYTDEVPGLKEKSEASMTLAQHLLVAADRYGLDRLKAMSERRLDLDMDVSTVATMLAVAEQHNCSRLKAKCIEFIAGGSQENLDVVLATEGYKQLVVNSPMLLTELLKAAHGRKRSRSPEVKYVCKGTRSTSS